MKENKFLTLKLCQKKEKLKKLHTRNINKKLNRKEVLHNCPRYKNKELRYELVENLENLKKQAIWLQKCIAKNGTLTKKLCYYKARTRKLEANKAKKFESDPSNILRSKSNLAQVAQILFLGPRPQG